MSGKRSECTSQSARLVLLVSWWFILDTLSTMETDGIRRRSRHFVQLTFCLFLLVPVGCASMRNERPELASMLITSRGILPDDGLMSITITCSDDNVPQPVVVFSGLIQLSSSHLTRLAIPARGNVTFKVNRMPTWYDDKEVTVAVAELLKEDDQLLVTVTGNVQPHDVVDMADHERWIELMSFEGIDVDVVDADYVVF